MNNRAFAAAIRFAENKGFNVVHKDVENMTLFFTDDADYMHIALVSITDEHTEEHVSPALFNKAFQTLPLVAKENDIHMLSLDTIKFVIVGGDHAVLQFHQNATGGMAA